MINFIKSTKRRLCEFMGRDDGTSSVEIVLVLPVFMMLFMFAYEGGMISMRHMMLERGLDLAVRDVRIGRMLDPKHKDLKDRICDYASIIPDCKNQLQLEMIPMDLRSWSTALDGPVECVDRAKNVQRENINYGRNNQMMVLQVCTLFDPVAPITGIGKYIPKENGSGAYALVATSAFVMEPFR